MNSGSSTYYYYPLCTKDFTFESMFSSESVSPCAFYPKRCFGVDYCYLIPGWHHRDALILYHQPPRYETGTEVNTIKFVLKIDERALNTDDLLFVDEGVMAYPGTVYLARGNCEVLFFSEKDMKVAQLKSETSLLTKGLQKYEGSFRVIDEQECVNFNTSNIEKLKIDPSIIEQAVAVDCKFNFLKGFVYGIASGSIGFRTGAEIQLAKSLQELVNNFAMVKNRADNRPKETARYVRPSSVVQAASTQVSDAKLRQNIRETARLFAEQHPGRPFSESALAEFLRTKFSHRLHTLEDAQRFVNYMLLIDEILGTDQLRKLKNAYFKQNTEGSPVYLFDIMEQYVDDYLTAVRSFQSKAADYHYDQFKKATFQLQAYLDDAVLERTAGKTLDLSPVRYNSIEDKIDVQAGFLNLSRTNRDEFVYISNVILQHPKLGRGEARKEIILQIVEQVGSYFSKNVPGKSTHLYQYLNNEVTEYSLDKVASVVMQNFVAFVFNPDSAEKLENYLYAKLIPESWIAYGFWCAFNGFANTSRNLVKPVFESVNSSLQTYLDKHLSELYAVTLALPISSAVQVKSSTEPSVNQLEEEEKNKNKLFYQRFIEGKMALGYEDFLDIIQLGSKEAILKGLSKKHKIGKKEGVKIMDAYNGFMESILLF